MVCLSRERGLSFESEEKRLGCVHKLGYVDKTLVIMIAERDHTHDTVTVKCALFGFQIGLFL